MTPRMTEDQWRAHERRVVGSTPKGQTRTERGRLAPKPIVCTGETQTLWIPGTLPGLNEIIALAKRQRGGYSPYNDVKAQWARNIAIYAERASLRPVVRARFAFEFIEQHRRRDPDNVAAGARKLILDGLVACGILPGDGWATTGDGWDDRFDVSATEPGVRVTIIPIEVTP